MSEYIKGNKSGGAPYPLEGIRVLEWGAYVTAPLACAMLAQLGAEVIKIEEPVKGDPLRGYRGHQGVTFSTKEGINIGFQLQNSNKKGLTLDLGTKEGLEIFNKLAKTSDIFCTNYREKILARLGLDYETVHRMNPKLIYAIGTSWGEKGPDADGRAVDYTIQARSGLMHLVGDREYNRPFFSFFGQSDVTGATTLTMGIITALFYRAQRGSGQKVETSMLHSQMYQDSFLGDIGILLHRPVSQHSRTGATNPLGNLYRCGDDKWLVLSEIQPDRFWHNFCEAVGLENYENDPRFKDMPSRARNKEALIKILDDLFATKPRDDWENILREKGGGLSFSRVNDIADLRNDPQVIANEYITTFEHPDLKDAKVTSFPLRFAECAIRPRGRAPELGESTEELLLEIGYGWDDIVALKEKGVV
ncbi:MAG: CoA transferase [Dehalococcoidia bacterium]